MGSRVRVPPRSPSNIKYLNCFFLQMGDVRCISKCTRYAHSPLEQPLKRPPTEAPLLFVKAALGVLAFRALIDAVDYPFWGFFNTSKVCWVSALDAFRRLRLRA